MLTSKCELIMGLKIGEGCTAAAGFIEGCTEGLAIGEVLPLRSTYSCVIGLCTV